jgi:hypothetical protein
MLNAVGKWSQRKNSFSANLLDQFITTILIVHKNKLAIIFSS